jgi:hypothetical protein
VGVVTKSLFNPKHPLNPDVLKNVVGNQIDPDKILPNFVTEKKNEKPWEFTNSLSNRILSFPRLRSLINGLFFSSTLRCQKNESTRLAFLAFF